MDTSRSAQSPSNAFLRAHVSRLLCRTPELSPPSNSKLPRTTRRQSPDRFRPSRRDDRAPSIFPALHVTPPPNLPNLDSAALEGDPVRPSRNAIRQTPLQPPQIPAVARMAPSAHNPKSLPELARDFLSSTPRNPIPTSPTFPAENSQSPHPLFSPAPAQSSALPAHADSKSHISYSAPSNATTAKFRCAPPSTSAVDLPSPAALP